MLRGLHIRAQTRSKPNVKSSRGKRQLARSAMKTVSDIYLSTVRSVFAWAHENELLPENVAEKVRQPKRVNSRETGYTDAEALAVLRACRAHVAGENYGDVTILAKARVIDALPDYDLK